MPSWPVSASPPTSANAVALVRLRIGADGRVKSATLDRGVHPAYNSTLIAEARKWTYKPATINGMPMESETVVSVRVTQ
jgi:TonB family protein